MMNMAAPEGEKGCDSRGSSPCRDMASAVLDDYTQSLIAMVEQSTQGLSISDIKNFLEEYKNKNVIDSGSVIRTQYQNCLTRCEQEAFDPALHREPFKRVFTSRIVCLFPPMNGLDDSGRYLSRRMLPGLFDALEKMVGSDVLKKGHILCKELIEDLKHTEQGFLWEDLYDNTQAQSAVDDLLIALVPHFENPMKRVGWLLNMINSDLAPAENYAFEGPASRDWVADEHGVILLLRALFDRFKQTLSTKDGAMQLTEHYGAENIRTLMTLLTELDKAELQ